MLYMDAFAFSVPPRVSGCTNPVLPTTTPGKTMTTGRVLFQHTPTLQVGEGAIALEEAEHPLFPP